MSRITREAHVLYKTGDADAPEQIKDRNGQVVLSCCRVCGKAEVELEQPCSSDAQAGTITSGTRIVSNDRPWSGQVQREPATHCAPELIVQAGMVEGLAEDEPEIDRIILSVQHNGLASGDMRYLRKLVRAAIASRQSAPPAASSESGAGEDIPLKMALDALRAMRERAECAEAALSTRDAASERALADFAAQQQPMPADMAKVLHDNLWELMEDAASERAAPDAQAGMGAVDTVKRALRYASSFTEIDYDSEFSELDRLAALASREAQAGTVEAPDTALSLLRAVAAHLQAHATDADMRPGTWARLKIEVSVLRDDAGTFVASDPRVSRA